MTDAMRSSEGENIDSAANPPERKALSSVLGLSRRPWRFPLAIAFELKRLVIKVCMIAALCFSSSAYAGGQSNATEPLPVVGMNDSLQIPPNEIPILRKKAERGDHEAALKLASHYGVYLKDKKRQVHYYKLAAKNGSVVAIENLVTIYSRTDADSFDFERALRWRRRLKELARKKGMEIESDAEWAYDLYLDHLTDKDRGLFFLRYAAGHGSEKARNELIQNHSNDRNTQVPENIRDWKERSDASNLTSTRTLALVSTATESRLLIDTPTPRASEGEPLLLNVTLRNESTKSISVPPLRFVTVKWSVSDATGERLERGGQLRLISDHGTPDIVVPAGAVLRNQMRLDINAMRGDTVKVIAYFGKQHPLVRNTLVVSCSTGR